jgi:hypothetical protein
MRRAIVVIGAGVVLALGAAAASAGSNNTSTDDDADSTQRVTGPAWCGFHDKAGDRVRCGYSSESECRQAVGGPDAICIVDPYVTENRWGFVSLPQTT